MTAYKVEIDEFVPPQKENEFREVVAALIEAKANGNHDPRANVIVPAEDELKVKRRIREAAQEAQRSARITGEAEVKHEKGYKGPAELRISFVLRPAITRKRDTDKSE